MVKKTAGELSIKALGDTTKYSVMDVADGISSNVKQGVIQCVENHVGIFNGISEFCVVCLISSDCLIKNLMRLKYFALPWLPKPRQDQSCFLYDGKKITHLWSLPNATTMAELSSLTKVHTKYERMKFWCDSFFDKRFWENIREYHKISILSEEEMVEKTPEKYKNIMSKINPNGGK